MSQLANQWIDLFRAGAYGGKGTFTEQDLQQIVDRYNPSHHEVPACIGHPESDAPAYGWFAKLRRVGDVLQGMMKPNVDPAFEEMVKAGRFTKRSVALYSGPDGFSLRHVAFLGAQPPEVKGLADIKFDQSKQAIEIEFSEEKRMPETPEQQQQGIVEGISAWLEKRFGKTPPAATFSEADVKTLVTEAVTAAVQPLKTQLDAQKTTFSETQTAQQKLEAGRRADAAIAGLKSKGCWVPAFDRAGGAVLFAELASRTETITFGEGDQKKTQTPLDLMVSFMESAGRIVPNEQRVGAEQMSGLTAKRGGAKVNAAVGAVDAGSERLHEAALEFAEKNKVDYVTALNKVNEQQPELAYSGGVSAGAV